MIVDWIRSRRQLLGELEEAREQCATAAALVADAHVKLEEAAAEVAAARLEQPPVEAVEKGPVEAVEQAPAVEDDPTVAGLQQELIEAQERIAVLQADLAEALHAQGAMQVERDDARRRLDEQVVRRGADDRVIVSPPFPLSPAEELLRERARADALAERLHVLQEANMRADCMHKPPAWRVVSGR